MSSYDTIKEVDCPRCHEQCGWCADPRHMHGTMRLPNFSGGKRRAYCTVPGMNPEGEDCPICNGRMRVLRTVTYSQIGSECPLSHDGFHHMDTSMETGSHHCFHCGANMRLRA